MAIKNDPFPYLKECKMHLFLFTNILLKKLKSSLFCYKAVRFSPLTFLSELHSTVEPLLTDTSLIRTPLYYRQFTTWSMRDRNSLYKPRYFSKINTSIMRTLIPAPLVSVIERFDCSDILGYPVKHKKDLAGLQTPYLSAFMHRYKRQVTV